MDMKERLQELAENARIRPFYLPVSGLILSALFRYPFPYILQISAVKSRINP